MYLITFFLITCNMKSLKMPSECKGLTVTVNRELTYHFHKA